MSKQKQDKNKSIGKLFDCYVVCDPEQAKEMEETVLKPFRKAFRSLHLVKRDSSKQKGDSKNGKRPSRKLD